MGYIVVDLFHGPYQNLDAIQHFVECGAQPFDFPVPALDFNPPVIGSLRYFLSCLGDIRHVG